MLQSLVLITVSYKMLKTWICLNCYMFSLFNTLTLSHYGLVSGSLHKGKMRKSCTEEKSSRKRRLFFIANVQQPAIKTRMTWSRMMTVSAGFMDGNV